MLTTMSWLKRLGLSYLAASYLAVIILGGFIVVERGFLVPWANLVAVVAAPLVVASISLSLLLPSLTAGPASFQELAAQPRTAVLALAFLAIWAIVFAVLPRVLQRMKRRSRSAEAAR